MNEQMNREYFQQRYDGAATPILDQNDRIESAIEEPLFAGEFEEFRSIALQGIQQEQQDHIAVLNQADNTLYDELFNNTVRLQTEIDTAQSDLSLSSEQMNLLQAAAEKAIMLSPFAAQKIKELVHAKSESIQSLSRAEAAQRVGALMLELDKLNDIYSVTGQAWPTPRVQSLKVNGVDSIITVDTLPVEPSTYEAADCMTSKMRETHGHLVGASLKVAGFLLSNVNSPVTIEEIADYTYADDEYFQGLTGADRKKAAAGRIPTLVNADRMRTAMKDAFTDKGFKLVYGKREFLNGSTGKHVNNTINIYQLVPLEDEVGPLYQTVVLAETSENTSNEQVVVAHETKVVPVNVEAPKIETKDLSDAGETPELKTLRKKMNDILRVYAGFGNMIPQEDLTANAQNVQITAIRLSNRKDVKGNATAAGYLKRLSDSLQPLPKGSKIDAASIIYLSISPSVIGQALKSAGNVKGKQGQVLVEKLTKKLLSEHYSQTKD